MSVIHTDCLTGLRMFPTAFFDSVVCDPPYALTSARPGGRSDATKGAVMSGFMGMKWDYRLPTVEEWSEVLRVLKPGGHMVAFGGTRTYHRLVVGIEDAGFEIRDQIGWVFGSGFPKSHNGEWGGTALKPAWEPICLARKPLEGTVESNWREHGTGALAIDACRVPGMPEPTRFDPAKHSHDGWRMNETGAEAAARVSPLGRWPANVIHDGSDEVLAAFPSAPGQIAAASTSDTQRAGQNTYGSMVRGSNGSEPRKDSGSAARFFYCAKASRKDRSEGLDTFPLKPSGMVSNTSGQHITRRDGGAPGPSANSHPTVKPTDLMRYLCRLITPAGGTVLDPWSGSGSTGKAAVLEGFGFIGFEREAEYVEIANARISHARGQL